MRVSRRLIKADSRRGGDLGAAAEYMWLEGRYRPSEDAVRGARGLCRMLEVKGGCYCEGPAGGCQIGDFNPSHGSGNIIQREGMRTEGNFNCAEGSVVSS